LEATPTASELLGKSVNELIGKDFFRIIKEQALEESFSKEDLVNKGCDIELNLNGVKRTVQISATSFNHSDALAGYVVLLRDKTYEKEIEEELRLHYCFKQESESIKNGGEVLCSESKIVGKSPVIAAIRNLIEKVAPTDATVLITGESGTGKELAASEIHRLSSRKEGPFVAFNCSAIPENLLESELFGHIRGSFTSADRDHKGLFRQADGGTLFLDEVGELPLHLQAKLLRVIQERAVKPVGSTHTIPVNVRLIAATNRNLKKEVEEGRFREDLYYRLNVINIHLPPLRERKGDIPLLVAVLLNKLTKGKGFYPVISPQAMRYLLNYTYPGNVRELENVLERALIFGEDAILPEHLPEEVRNSTKDLTVQKEKEPTKIYTLDDLEFPVNLEEILKEVERKYLEAALERAQGVKTKAAELLGINFRSFRYRLQKFNI
ncbi:MAG: sigma-54-dependent Fis family transcriptional regulator, partial [Candidatus Dadabacteria bacterium]